MHGLVPLALLGLTSFTAAAQTTYDLQPSASHLSVLVEYDRDALIAGHDHIIEATTFTGTVTWNPDDPSACAIDISFPVTALAVDPGNSRSRHGLEGSTSDGDKGKIRDNLQGRYQLEAKKYPSISFESKECKASGGAFQVSGPLSLHGVSHTVSALMKITEDGSSFSAQGTFSATHDDWGFKPFTALLGSLRNAPGLTFHVDVSGKAQ